MREAEEDEDLAGGVETLVARLGHACSRSRPQELLCHLVGHNGRVRLCELEGVQDGESKPHVLDASIQLKAGGLTRDAWLCDPLSPTSAQQLLCRLGERDDEQSRPLGRQAQCG